MTITQFTLEGPENEEYMIEVAAREHPSEQEVIIVYTISGAGKFETQIRVNFEQNTMLFTGLEAPAVAYVSCIAFHGLGHLAQEIMDCLRQGHRTPVALLRCLRAKGHKISKGLIACVFECLPSFFPGKQ